MSRELGRFNRRFAHQLVALPGRAVRNPAILALRTLSNLEYRAAERIPQVSIEASIGVAKHWPKRWQAIPCQDAYQAFEFLCPTW